MAVYPERRKGKLTGFFYGETLHKGKRFRDRFDTMAQAQGYVDHIKVLGYAPGKDQVVTGKTFAEVAKEALAEHPKWKRGRDTNLVARLEYVVSLIGGTAVAAVDRSILQKIVTSLEKRPGKKPGSRLSGKTINRYLAAASGVLTFAESKGYCGATPTVPWQEEEGGAIGWFTHEMEAAVVGWLNAQGKNASALCVRVLAATGMRRGEFLSLEPEQIEDTWVRLWKNKTDHPRSVPIELDMASALRAIVAAGGLPDAGQLYRDLKAACKACGYSADLTIHSLRHTTATRVLAESGDLKLAQEFLGHKAIATTSKYAHITSERLQEVAKKVAHARGKTHETSEVVEFASTRKRA